MSALPSARVDVLAVDDTPSNLRSLEALLEDLGANLVAAHSGSEALRHLLERDFALILLDVQMPGLDGYETARLVRARDRTRHIPIIFITAYTRSEVSVTRAYELGAVDYLFKPIIPAVLRTKVSVFLDLHRRSAEVRHQAELLRQAEHREHQRKLAEARSQYEQSLLREEMKRERKVAEALEQRAGELARLVREKERAEEALQQSNARLRLLADTANALLMRPADGTPLSAVYEPVARHLGFDAYLEYLVQEGDGHLHLTAHSGLPTVALPGLGVVRPGEGLAGRAAAERRRLLLMPGISWEGFAPDASPALGLGALACFPLLFQGRVLGTLTFATRAARVFTEDELSLLQGVCNQLSVALERERLIGELREADRRKDEFLAMLAHELRNPLAPVRHALEVFRLRMWQDAVVQRTIASADRQVAHMTRLVDDLLDVSRITRGKVELRKAPVTLTELVEAAVQACEPLITQRQHALGVELPSEPLVLVVDPTRMTQVVANLLHNAAKYTPSGGRITLSARREDSEVVVTVRDSGIGIRPDMLHRVFDLFVQVDPGSDRAQGGLGLGLTLVRRLVEMHGGSVRAHSEGPGKGSEFSVRLPLLQEARAEQLLVRAVAPAPPPRALTPLHILLVEDNPDIRETLRELLELQGHRVEEASDGRSAVELLLARRPQVALVDIGLPEMDGYKVAETVRSAAGAGPPRLVALTGYGHPEDRRRALEAGFDAHLVKPVSSEDLTRILHSLCSSAA